MLPIAWLARFAAVIALGFPGGGAVSWLAGPWAPVVVCERTPGACRLDGAAAGGACLGGPAISSQWSPFGTSTTRADLSVVVTAAGPLAAVSIVRPGSTATAATWGASGDGASVFRWASSSVAPVGVLEVIASDARGCVVHLRAIR